MAVSKDDQQQKGCYCSIEVEKKANFSILPPHSELGGKARMLVSVSRLPLRWRCLEEVARVRIEALSVRRLLLVAESRPNSRCGSRIIPPEFAPLGQAAAAVFQRLVVRA